MSDKTLLEKSNLYQDKVTKTFSKSNLDELLEECKIKPIKWVCAVCGCCEPALWFSDRFCGCECHNK